jgi:hypothetical protein
MLVKISITEEWDLNDDMFFSDDDPFFEDNKESYDTEARVELMINRFCEDIDSLVKYDSVRDAITVEYIDE